MYMYYPKHVGFVDILTAQISSELLLSEIIKNMQCFCLLQKATLVLISSLSSRLFLALAVQN